MQFKSTVFRWMFQHVCLDDESSGGGDQSGGRGQQLPPRPPHLSADLAAFNIPNAERAFRTLLMFIPLHQLNSCALAGRQALSLRGARQAVKSSYKNHLQNQLRCRPYGCEFNKDKPHLLTAACSLGLQASLLCRFCSLLPFNSFFFLGPQHLLKISYG